MVGVTTLSNGTLQINNPLALEGQTLTRNALDAGTLSVGAGLPSLSLGGLSGNGNLSLASIPLIVGLNNSSTTFSGNLTGPSSLTMAGTGSLYLSGSNSNGATIVQSGILDAQQASALSGYASAGSVSVASGASLNIQTGIAPLGWSSGQIGALVAANSGGFAAGSTLGIDTSSGGATYPGNIPMALNKLGANTLTLAGNSYGPLNVNAGVGAVAFTAASPTVGPLTGAGSVILGNAGVNPTNLTVNSNANSVFSGVISRGARPQHPDQDRRQHVDLERKQ